jgi:heme-degrading monooxygenase HmoA
MHAVVVRVAIEDYERGRTFLTEQVVPRVKQAPGFVAGYWTRSEDGDGGLSMMVFESEDAARGVLQMMESQAPQDEGVKVEGIELREVVANA